ncbi:MAG: Maf family nucleotide pyrophosphatase [Steroidobacteraceae bacterium]
MNTPRRLLLASTSPYRRALLARLRLPFDVTAPEVDEGEISGEAPADRAARLALAKAHAGARSHPGSVVIGSDQVASLDGTVLRKPGEVSRARAQLARLAGQTARFDTAVAVLDGPDVRQHVDTTIVRFRPFDADALERYLATESALDCAGGFKAEGLGIALMEQLESRDPTAIVGLPLIWTAGALRAAGFAVP